MKLLTTKEWLIAIKMFLVSIPLEISSFLIAPFLYFFVDKKTGFLPKWLSWYDEPNYGAFGDYGWKQSHFKEPDNRTWWAVTRWYWRNRINGYQIDKQGYNVEKTDISTLRILGDPNATSIRGRADTFCVVRVKDTSQKEYFALYYEKKWCKYFYLRMYIGWKLMDISNMKTASDIGNWISRRKSEGKSTTLESVFSINPFKKLGQTVIL